MVVRVWGWVRRHWRRLHAIADYLERNAAIVVALGVIGLGYVAYKAESAASKARTTATALKVQVVADAKTTHRLTVLAGELTTAQAELKAIHDSAAANRVANVKEWCTLIREGRDYNRAVAQAKGVPYRLRDPNCVALERGTEASEQSPSR